MKITIENFKLTTNPRKTGNGTTVAWFDVVFSWSHNCLTINRFSLFKGDNNKYTLNDPYLRYQDGSYDKNILANYILKKKILDTVVPMYENQITYLIG